jgi:hypothetical protein
MWTFQSRLPGDSLATFSKTVRSGRGQSEPRPSTRPLDRTIDGRKTKGSTLGAVRPTAAFGGATAAHGGGLLAAMFGVGTRRQRRPSAAPPAAPSPHSGRSNLSALESGGGGSGGGGGGSGGGGGGGKNHPRDRGPSGGNAPSRRGSSEPRPSTSRPLDRTIDGRKTKGSALGAVRPTAGLGRGTGSAMGGGFLALVLGTSEALRRPTRPQLGDERNRGIDGGGGVRSIVPGRFGGRGGVEGGGCIRPARRRVSAATATAAQGYLDHQEARYPPSVQGDGLGPSPPSGAWHSLSPTEDL